MTIPSSGRIGGIMSHHQICRASRFNASLFLATLLFLPAHSLLAQPSLRITSPADGTLVNPGQSLKVTVEASGRFQQVILIGAQPMGGTVPLSAPPYEFTIKIPNRISPRRYSLTADGCTAPGQCTSSKPIMILVELADESISLRVQPSLLRLYIGDKGYLMTYGVFPDGQRADLSKSTQTSFTSNAPGVATIDHQGIVTPVAPGSATITITYRDAHVEIPVTVLAKDR
jgi:hypothetical protein